MRADIEDLHDAGVLDAADRARFVEEPLHVLGVLRDRSVEQLDRDVRADVLLLGEPDLAHAADTDASDDLEISDRLPDHVERWYHRSLRSLRAERAQLAR